MALIKGNKMEYKKLTFPQTCQACRKVIYSLGAYKRHTKKQAKNCPGKSKKYEITTNSEEL